MALQNTVVGQDVLTPSQVAWISDRNAKQLSPEQRSYVETLLRLHNEGARYIFHQMDDNGRWTSHYYVPKGKHISLGEARRNSHKLLGRYLRSVAEVDIPWGAE